MPFFRYNVWADGRNIPIISGRTVGFETVIYPALTSSSLPPAFVAVRVMSYVPAAKLNDGFFVVANCVHPTLALRYAHLHTFGVFVDVSVNATLSGPVPLRGVAVKFATGAGGGATVTEIYPA